MRHCGRAWEHWGRLLGSAALHVGPKKGLWASPKAGLVATIPDLLATERIQPGGRLTSLARW